MFSNTLIQAQAGFLLFYLLTFPTSLAGENAPEIRQQTETISGREVPTAILLEQFVQKVDFLRSIEDGTSPTPWEEEVLSKLEILPGSEEAGRLKELVQRLSIIFGERWLPSTTAETDQALWSAEQDLFNQRKLKKVAQEVARYAQAPTQSGNPANQLFRYLEDHIQPEVTTYVVGTSDEWEEGDPAEDFKNKWLTFDQELARLLSTSSEATQ